MACSSLFEYLVQLNSYTPASAQRRIDAARMMLQVPELGGKIEDGSLKLKEVSQVKQKIQREGSVRVELTFSKVQMEILNRAGELLSHALPGAALAEVIASLTKSANL